MPPRTAPFIYEQFTEGASYVLAMVESPESFARSRAYQTSDEERRILATYPASGVYRTGELSKPILEVASALPEWDVVGFFEKDGDVYLITGRRGDLKFFRGAKLIREFGGHEQLEWITAPWFHLIECGAGPGVDIRFDRTGPREEVVVDTIEGSSFRYDALTGRLVSVDRRSFGSPQPPTPAEQDLAVIVHRLVTESHAEPDESPDFALGPHMSDIWVEGCQFVERGDDWNDPDLQRSGDSQAPSLRSLGIEAHGGSRLRHGNEAVFDLYRVAAGRGSQFLCGIDVLEGDLFEEKIRKDVGPNGWEPVWQHTKTAFQDPTIAAILTWDVAPGGDWEGADRVGIATLWSRATGEWRVIMVHTFAVPAARK